MELINYVVSVGRACPCAFAIKTANLKLFSCPFDWIVSSPWMVESCIDDDFKSYLDKTQYYHTVDRNGSYCHHKMYGLGVFNHHCPLHKPEHHAYLQRCVDRFRKVRAQERHNVGVRLSDKKDNEMVAAVFKWYTYDLKALEEQGETKVWPYSAWNSPWWKRWLCIRA